MGHSSDLPGHPAAEAGTTSDALEAERLLLQAVIDSLPFNVWICGLDGRYSIQNAIGRSIWGDHVGLLPQQTGVPPEIVNVWLDTNRRALAGEVVRGEHCYEYRGQTICVEEILAPLRAPNGRMLGFLGINLDISERKRADAALRASEARLRAAIESLPFGFWLRDREGRLIAHNAHGEAAWGCPLGSRPEDVGLPDELIQEWTEFSRRALAGEIVRYEVTREIRGEERRLEKIVAPIRENAEVKGLLGIEIDVTERVRAEQHIRRLALLDALTELPNRTLLLDRLEQALARARRQGGSLTVMLLDLDQFKDVNDTLGHPAGDRLLRAVAERIRTCVRESDTLARLGGDEFALIQLDVQSAADAAILAAKILEVLEPPFELGGQEVYASASLGIAVATAGEPDGGTLLKHADLALYRAKADGRACYRFFEPGMDVAARVRREVDRELRRALDRDELVLHYQPQIDLATGRAIGAEALIRWRHPERGLLLPGEFVPVAETTGLIRPLGEWVLSEACRQARRWRDQGCPLIVAVNLSAAQLRFGQLVSLVREALERSRLDPGALELEFVEESLAEGAGGDAMATLHELASLGVRLAIDDFGVGRSSLADLRRVPIRKIKIDHAFIGPLDGSAEAAALLGAIVGLGRSLGHRVSAEGVETERQLAQLRTLGCDEAQGFLLGSPQTAHDMEQMLSRSVTVPTAGSVG